jgi:nucleoside-diphosphate-sugar epimerase
MKVLVTGPTGFVGKALVEKLKADGHEVVAAGRAESGAIETTRWDDVLPGVDTIVHLAARVHQMRDTSVDPLVAFRAVNRDATVRLGEAARKHGVKRFIFLSSVKAAVDKTGIEGVDETMPPVPQSPYGISKLEAEQALLSMPEIGPVILRPPLIYGPGAKGNLAGLARLIKRGIPLPVGGIDNRRSFLGLGNLVAAIEAALIAPDIEGQVFYVADDKSLSTAELVRALGVSLGRNNPILFININILNIIAKLFSQQERLARLTDSLVIENDKFKAATGWRPVISLQEELARFAAALY